jgi:hypothetical protein
LSKSAQNGAEYKSFLVEPLTAKRSHAYCEKSVEATKLAAENGKSPELDVEPTFL